MKTYTVLVPLLTLACACTGDIADEADGRDDSFLITKGDAAGIADGSADAAGVLRVANESSASVLRKNVRLTARAADNIVAFRLGPDGVAGTADDRQFRKLKELDDVPYVGPATLQRMLAYARSNGLVPGPVQIFALELGELPAGSSGTTGTWRNAFVRIDAVTGARTVLGDAGGVGVGFPMGAFVGIDPASHELLLQRFVGDAGAVVGLDLTTGVLRQRFPLANSYVYLSRDPASGSLFGIENAQPVGDSGNVFRNAFVKLDPLTGARTELGDAGGAGVGFPSGMTVGFDPAATEFLLERYTSTGVALAGINLVTGELHERFPLANSFIYLARDPAQGALFGVESAVSDGGNVWHNPFVELDPTRGTRTELGEVGGADVGFPSGVNLGFDPVTEELLVERYTSGADESSVVAIDQAGAMHPRFTLLKGHIDAVAVQVY